MNRPLETTSLLCLLFVATTPTVVIARDNVKPSGLLAAVSLAKEKAPLAIPRIGKTPEEPPGDFMNQIYRGATVTVITKDSITVQTRVLLWRAARPGPGGSTLWHTEVVPAEPPKRFAVSEVLAAGGIPKVPRGNYSVRYNTMYRLTDVKVGDSVYVIYSKANGMCTCDHIKIVKRPGGRVPPLPEGVKERSFIPYHEYQNAYWDLEDKGIPYPEHFKHLRRWPLAPPPRAIPERHPIQ